MFKDPTFQAYPWIFYNISFEDDVTIILILGVSLLEICISSGYNRAMCLNVVLFSEQLVQNYSTEECFFNLPRKYQTKIKSEFLPRD